MNWKQIKEQFPICFDALFYNKPNSRFTIGVLTFEDKHSYLAILDNGMYYSKVDFHCRKLYDFFDDNGIHVFIKPNYNGYVPVIHRASTGDRNLIHAGKPLYHSRSMTSRQKAEEKAFMKAFELLERQLTK